MNAMEAEVVVAARSCSLVKEVKVEELEFDGKPLLQVTIDSYPVFDSSHDLDDLLRNIKRKVQPGYLLKVRLEFFI